MADSGHEVRLHLGDLLEPAGHLGLCLVSPDLAEHQPGGGGERAELLELVLREVSHVGIADDDHPHPHRLHLERRHQGLLQTQLAQEDVGVAALLDLFHVYRLDRPIGLGDDAGSVDLHGDLLGVQRVAVDPDRAHHLETLQLVVLEQDHAHLCVEVLADGAHELGDDLGQRLRPGQGGADRVEALEIETLLEEASLLAGRGDRLLLELEPDEGGRRAHDEDGDYRSHDVGDGVGRAAGHGQLIDRHRHGDVDEGVGPPGEHQPRDRGDPEEDRLGGRGELGHRGDGGDPHHHRQQPT